jgi:hypothetical protein
MSDGLNPLFSEEHARAAPLTTLGAALVTLDAAHCADGATINVYRNPDDGLVVYVTRDAEFIQMAQAWLKSRYRPERKTPVPL